MSRAWLTTVVIAGAALGARTAYAQPAAPCPVITAVDVHALDHSRVAPAVSADGRFYAFRSLVEYAVADKPEDVHDNVYVYDRTTGTIEKITKHVAPTGTPGGNRQVAISGNGQVIAFESASSDLIEGDVADDAWDLFVYDRPSGVMQKAVARIAPGGQRVHATRMVLPPVVSHDGRYVAFVSHARGLGTPPDADDWNDVYVLDRSSGAVEKVSQAVGGGPANGHSGYRPGGPFIAAGDLEGSYGLGMSADGRIVAFVSQATNLAAGSDPTDHWFDVFVHDRTTGLTTQVTPGGDGRENQFPFGFPQEPGKGTGLAILGVHVSASGSHVAFASLMKNLIPAQEDDPWDEEGSPVEAYVYTRATGEIHKASVDVSGDERIAGIGWSPSLSADGRYVAFASQASRLIENDVDDLFCAVYVRDMVAGHTVRVSVAPDGGPPYSGYGLGWLTVPGAFLPTILPDGSEIVFEARDWDLLPALEPKVYARPFIAPNCLAVPPPPPPPPPPLEPAIAWEAPMPASVEAGAPVTLRWSLAGFDGPITQHQAHYGVTSVLGTSEVMAAANGTYEHTFTVPSFPTPTNLLFVVRALNDGEQVLSSFASTQVLPDATPPAVTWVTPPPTQVANGGRFTVQWEVSGFDAPLVRNGLAYGITSILGQTANQLDGNRVYTATFQFPLLSSSLDVRFAPVVQAQGDATFLMGDPMSVHVPVP